MYQSGTSINNPDPYVNMNFKTLGLGVNDQEYPSTPWKKNGTRPYRKEKEIRRIIC
jgi:hypothetical protein